MKLIKKLSFANSKTCETMHILCGKLMNIIYADTQLGLKCFMLHVAPLSGGTITFVQQAGINFVMTFRMACFARVH